MVILKPITFERTRPYSCIAATHTHLLEVGLLGGDAFGLDHAFGIVGLDTRGVRLRLLRCRMQRDRCRGADADRTREAVQSRGELRAETLTRTTGRIEPMQYNKCLCCFEVNYTINLNALP